MLQAMDARSAGLPSVRQPVEKGAPHRLVRRPSGFEARHPGSMPLRARIARVWGTTTRALAGHTPYSSRATFGRWAARQRWPGGAILLLYRPCFRAARSPPRRLLRSLEPDDIKIVDLHSALAGYQGERSKVSMVFALPIRPVANGSVRKPASYLSAAGYGHDQLCGWSYPNIT
jgi:hypothetical protein